MALLKSPSARYALARNLYVSTSPPLLVIASQFFIARSNFDSLYISTAYLYNDAFSSAIFCANKFEPILSTANKNKKVFLIAYSLMELIMFSIWHSVGFPKYR